jgi:deoxyribodipyrimidine photo-lyase
MASKSAPPCIVWFRDDLRLSDHCALHAASKREGEKWFWDTLVDADPGSNPANWQWVAGCGADAAPYFRVFNPILQGEKFDPDGAYVRRWVPELAQLPAGVIHRPWSAMPLELASSGVELGKTYPEPIVDHRKGRERALAAYAKVRNP